MLFQYAAPLYEKLFFYCETCHNQVKMRMRNGYGDKMRNGYGNKMRHFNEFFASFLRFCVFDLCFFVMDATSY